MKNKNFKLSQKTLFFGLLVVISLGLVLGNSSQQDVDAEYPCNCASLGKIYGGNGGTSFKDGPFGDGVRINRILISSGDRIDSIQVEWILPCGSLFMGIKHGGEGGKLSIIQLKADEYIKQIAGRSGTMVDQLTFYTNKGRIYGPFGKPGGDPFNINLNISRVIGFYGRSGTSLDAIGIITCILKFGAPKNMK